MDKTLGRFIREQRRAKGLTQEALGAQLGISQAEVSRLENGDPPTALLRLKRLSVALGFEAGEVFQFIPDDSHCAQAA